MFNCNVLYVAVVNRDVTPILLYLNLNDGYKNRHAGGRTRSQ